MIFTIKVCLCLFTFHVFVLTEPSYVPSPYVPDAEGAAVPPHQEPLNNVLGPNMLKWFCPAAVSHLKDGMSYPTAHDC
ncbi:hypothetical protein Peur_043432 [Populus x canadensis]